MTLREVQDVARLAAESGATVHGGGPTVHKVADALGLPPTEVELLLDQARQGGSPIRAFKIAAGVAALALMFLLGAGTTSLFGSHASPQAVAVSTPVTPSAGAPIGPLPASGAVAAAGPTPSGAPVASNDPASQLSAPAGTLEAKTTDGDVRRAVELARKHSTPLVQNGGGGGRIMSTAPQAALAQ